MIDKICELIVKKTSKVLHLPTYELFYSIEQTLDGKVITDTGNRRAKSWVRNSYNNLFSTTAWVNNSGTPFGAGSLSYINTGGANLSYAECKWSIQQVGTHPAAFNAAAGVASYGILIGTGTTAWSFENYTIDGYIGEGMGAGQINYGSTVYSSTYASGTPTMSQWYLRYFNNNSGGDITLGNIGLISVGHVTYGPSALACRDVLSPAETFYDKAQLKIQYTIYLTFP